jgi:hypothetical protein
MARVLLAFGICLLLGIAVAMFESAFGPLGQAMELNVIIVGLVLLGPIFLPLVKR